MQKVGILFCLGSAFFCGALIPCSARAQDGDVTESSDTVLLEKAAAMNADELKETIGVYGRLGRKDLLLPLAEELLKREPDNEVALAIKEGQDLDFGIDPKAGEGMAEDRLDGQITRLKESGRHREVVGLLTQLRSEKYANSTFPYQQDLAYAYYDAGDTTAAAREFSTLAATAGADQAERDDARRMIDDIARNVEIQKVDALLKTKGAGAGMVAAESVLERWPKHPDALALKARILTEQGNIDEAGQILESLRAKSTSQGIFAYESDVADIHLARKDYDAAEKAYQGILDSKSADAEMKREASLGLADVAKARDLAAADTLLTQLDAKGAHALIPDLRAKYPGDPDIDILEGEIKLLQGDAAGAVSQLQAVKEKHYSGLPFPGQPDLAHGLYAMNDLDAASAAYLEVIDDPFHDAQARQDATVDLRDLNWSRRSEIALDGFAETEDEGDAFSAISHFKGPVWGDWRAWAWGRVDSISLSEDSILTDRDSDRFEGGVALENRYSSAMSTALRLGGSDEDFIAGFDLTYKDRRGGFWGTHLDYNQRADDSLTLQALDGRQNKFVLWTSLPITPRVILEANAFGRNVEVFGDSIGDGWGTEVNLDYIVMDAKLRQPTVKIGYAGEVSIFHGGEISREINDETVVPLDSSERHLFVYDLVEQEINLHGLQLTLEGTINPDLAYFVVGAAQWDFFDQDMQYRAATGLEYFLSDRTRLTGTFEYLSSGQTSNTGDAVVLGTLGIAVSF